MSNPSPNVVVKSVTTAGYTSLVELTPAAVAAHIQTLLGQGIPPANIFAFVGADLTVATQTVITINGQTV